MAGRVAGGPARAEAVAPRAAPTAPAAGRTLRWTDGFTLALTMPATLIATLGYSVGALGAWSAVALWGLSMLIAAAANWLYAELAGMFPSTSGGISLYANEGWRSRLPLAGPVGTFGYSANSSGLSRKLFQTSSRRICRSSFSAVGSSFLIPSWAHW